MVTGGGGIESTDITVEVYDDNGVLVDTPTLVRFVLGPNVPAGAHLENGTDVDSSYTNNGIASIPLNSGTAPGPVRVTAFVGCPEGVVSAVANGYILRDRPPVISPVRSSGIIPAQTFKNNGQVHHVLFIVQSQRVHDDINAQTNGKLSLPIPSHDHIIIPVSQFIQ